MKCDQLFEIPQSRQEFPAPVAVEEIRRQGFFSNGWILTLNREQILVGWGKWLQTEGSPTLGQCRIYTPDFYLESKHPWKMTEHFTLISRLDFARLMGIDQTSGNSVAENQSFGGEKFSEKLNWLEPSEEIFSEAWAKIQAGFKERGLKKAVPAVYATAHCETGLIGIERFLAAVAALPGELYPYGFWQTSSVGTCQPHSEGMIGATPEVLFSQLQPDVIETMALAGTRPRSPDSSDIDFLSDVKERREHQLVVDDIMERLLPFGSIAVNTIKVLKLPTLEHLLTEISLQADEVPSFTELVETLHPTPALGVAPRGLGFDEMKLWESNRDRGRFGAPFGADWGTGRHCVVAIRNIQWSGESVQLGTGCGVIEQSLKEKEWAELSLKREAIKRMLDL